MQKRGMLALAAGLLGSGVLACSGSVTEEPSEPAPRPAATVGASGGSAAASSSTAALANAAGSSGRPDDSGDEPSASSTGGTGGASSTPPDPSDVPALPPLEFCDAPNKVFLASCGNGSCHSNKNTTIGDFGHDEQSAYKFVDRVSVRNADCGKIIDSADYSKSLLLTKLNGDFESPKCGQPMPTGSFLITNEQIDCVASWLQQFQL